MGLTTKTPTNFLSVWHGGQIKHNEVIRDDIFDEINHQKTNLLAIVGHIKGGRDNVDGDVSMEE